VIIQTQLDSCNTLLDTCDGMLSSEMAYICTLRGGSEDHSAAITSAVQTLTTIATGLGGLVNATC
jgi:hypothetical protein